MGPKLLSLLDYVHSGGLVYHLHEKLTAWFLLMTEAGVGDALGKQLRVRSPVAFQMNSSLGVA